MEKTECTYCDKKVKDVKRHIYREHKEGKAFCDECGKTYKNKFELKQHWLLTHKIEEDINCFICNKSFRNMARLKRHAKPCISKGIENAKMLGDDESVNHIEAKNVVFQL